MNLRVPSCFSGRVLGLAALGFVAASAPAYAHVKWFAPYIVGAPPQPIGATLTNIWFWTGIALVLVFFLATRAVEKSSAGETILRAMDRITDPLWKRLDDFVRVVIAAFFVAIFAVGGVYLTPDLKTPAEWVSWTQLVIAGLIFSRKTQPLAAAGIIGLWLLALRDYGVFHLLDYLALGVGVGAYLVLEASSNPEWRKHRFEALRWGVAIALMWSSLEKFAYPDWFCPLVDEKPFLTFGMPRDMFIPMAGVAEFTMGFGLIWTPLVRRLSAIALFIIFNAAVYPFGRVDLIGHALIIASIVAIAANHTREVHFLPALKRRLAGVPVGLTAALVIFVTGYWGLHIAIYGIEGTPGPTTAERLTHTPNVEQAPGPALMVLPTVETAIAARVVQGTAAVIVTPASLALIGATYPRAERNRAIGVWAAASALTTAGGPVLGGWLTETFGWPSVFWINPPLALVAVAILLVFAPEDRREQRRFDVIGAAILASALGTLAWALSQIGPSEAQATADAPVQPGTVLTIVAGLGIVGLAVAAATSIGGAFTASITLTPAAAKAGGSGGA